MIKSSDLVERLFGEKMAEAEVQQTLTSAQHHANALAAKILAARECPEDLIEWGRIHGIPTFAQVTWQAGFLAGMRAAALECAVAKEAPEHDLTAATIRSLAAERDAASLSYLKVHFEFHKMPRRIARQRRALAKLYQRRHDKNEEIARVSPLNPDRWRGAINDALTNWMDSILDNEVPKDALRRLIQHEISAAVDPAVSQAAADLVATARREGMEEAAQIADATAHANRVEYPKKWKDRPEGIPHDWSVAWETCAETAEEIAAAIRAAAGEVK
jgi:hypothetical protein